MIDPNSFRKLRLRGGYIIDEFNFVEEPLVDALGRPALARTRILGRKFQITIFFKQRDDEKSITIYHEILEAMTVASMDPPASVSEFVETDFEQAAYDAYNRFGPAWPTV